MSKLSECNRNVWASGLFISYEDDGFAVSGTNISSITCRTYKIEAEKINLNILFLLFFFLFKNSTELFTFQDIGHVKSISLVFFATYKWININQSWSKFQTLWKISSEFWIMISIIFPCQLDKKNVTQSKCKRVLWVLSHHWHIQHAYGFFFRQVLALKEYYMYAQCVSNKHFINKIRIIHFEAL